ncbi:hypothetical protein C0J52_19195 [Blattella germanica]|nr:hypothetical protein C0J52_19195 [Blattella germanica]
MNHGSCFNASITLRPTPCAVPQTPTSGTMPMEPQSARVFPSAASSDLIPGSRIGTTFNPEPISTPLATTEPISIGSSVPAPQTPSSSGLLQGPSTSSIASVGPGGHDALYHSTKF